MAWLIVDLHGNYGRVVGVSLAGIWILMFRESGNIFFLCSYGFRIFVNPAFFEVICKCPCIDVFFRISVAEIGLGGQNNVDSTLEPNNILYLSDYQIIHSILVVI